jgi:hypothetical protein
MEKAEKTMKQKHMTVRIPVAFDIGREVFVIAPNYLPNMELCHFCEGEKKVTVNKQSKLCIGCDGSGKAPSTGKIVEMVMAGKIDDILLNCDELSIKYDLRTAVLIYTVKIKGYGTEDLVKEEIYATKTAAEKALRKLIRERG